MRSRGTLCQWRQRVGRKVPLLPRRTTGRQVVAPVADPGIPRWAQLSTAVNFQHLRVQVVMCHSCVCVDCPFETVEVFCCTVTGLQEYHSYYLQQQEPGGFVPRKPLVRNSTDPSLLSVSGFETLITCQRFTWNWCWNGNLGFHCLECI